VSSLWSPVTHLQLGPQRIVLVAEWVHDPWHSQIVNGKTASAQYSAEYANCQLAKRRKLPAPPRFGYPAEQA
jgi:hypothetical protein